MDQLNVSDKIIIFRTPDSKNVYATCKSPFIKLSTVLKKFCDIYRSQNNNANNISFFSEEFSRDLTETDYAGDIDKFKCITIFKVIDKVIVLPIDRKIKLLVTNSINKIYFDVDTCMSIKQLYETILANLEVQKSFNMYFQNMHLHHDALLRDYGICDMNEIYITDHKSIICFKTALNSVQMKHISISTIGNAFNVDLPGNTSIGDIIKYINTQHNINVASLHTHEIQLDKCVMLYEIDDNSVLLSDDVIEQRSLLPTFAIFVKLLDKTKYLEVCDNTTIYEIKHKIHMSDGFPICKQRLIGYTQLDNCKTIRDYRISKESTLHMVLTLHGGMFHHTSGKKGNFDSVMPIEFTVSCDE